MANRYFSGVQSLHKEMKIIAGRFTTNNTSAPVLVAGLGVEVTRTGVGVFDVKPIYYDKGIVKYDVYPAYISAVAGGEEAVTSVMDHANNKMTITLAGGADTTGNEISFVIIAQNSTTPSV